jgi:hypothetical protein
MSSKPVPWEYCLAHKDLLPNAAIITKGVPMEFSGFGQKLNRSRL